MVFGGSGGLGQAIVSELSAQFDVIATSRTGSPGTIRVQPNEAGGLTALETLGPLSAVVWAQGVNCNDDVGHVDDDSYRGVMAANVDYVVATMNCLRERALLLSGAGLCILSSVWQEVARPGKLSYTISKAALGGLVRAAAVDLAADGIRVNAVLPGVVDTPMTRAVLSPEQYSTVTRMTPLQRLTTPQEVARVVAMLVDERSSAVTGQSIAVDGGFSLARMI